MPWLLNLYETYNANEVEIGKIRMNQFGKKYTLIPEAHTTQNAHVEVAITEDGEFHTASVIEKDNANTLIPSTIDSASRAGAAVYPYPLHDKLSYVAGDFVDYGGKIGKENPFDVYIRQLGEWANSTNSHPTIQSIYKYLLKKSLISDLVNEKILFLDENDMLIEGWKKEYETIHGDKPKIFSVVTGGQHATFVRFHVHSTDRIIDKPWTDKSLFKSFTEFYKKQVGNEDICYVTGKISPSTDKHANKIRHAADKAKLISGNDTSGFTFRGKFNKSDEVASIGYEVSQKAHNALRWLIDKQGKMIDQRVFLIWGNNLIEIADIQDNTYDLVVQMGWEEPETKVSATTNQAFAKEFSNAVDGYRHNLNSDAKINVLVMDSATTGRMGVLYYRNMNNELYFDRLKKWHTSCTWRHHFRDKHTKQYMGYIGAPSTKDIAFAAYGSHASDKLVKSLMERMLPSILEEREIPIDIVKSAISRASNPVSMENWEWQKTLSIACALINQKEGIDVGLDRNNDDRDYLFGRLLAVADVLERSALDKADKRTTNAIRYMNAFSQHPARTWATIQNSLQPYEAKLGGRAIRYTRIIDEIGSKIKMEDFNDKPLSGKYLLGLYSQRYELYKKSEEKDGE